MLQGACVMYVFFLSIKIVIQNNIKLTVSQLPRNPTDQPIYMVKPKLGRLSADYNRFKDEVGQVRVEKVKAALGNFLIE